MAYELLNKISMFVFADFINPAVTSCMSQLGMPVSFEKLQAETHGQADTRWQDLKMSMAIKLSNQIGATFMSEPIQTRLKQILDTSSFQQDRPDKNTKPVSNVQGNNGKRKYVRRKLKTDSDGEKSKI